MFGAAKIGNFRRFGVSRSEKGPRVWSLPPGLRRKSVAQRILGGTCPSVLLRPNGDLVGTVFRSMAAVRLGIADAEDLSQFCQCESVPLIRDKDRTAAILRLLVSRFPLAVFWRVRAVIVDSVQCFFEGPYAIVLKICL